LVALLFCGQAWADVKKIEGTTNVEDSWMQSGFPDVNRGADDHFIVSSYISIIRVKNVASELGVGATITGCVCSLYCYYETDATVSAYRVFKPWVEGTQDGGEEEPGVTWNDWDNDAYPWTDPGCACANDDGVDNSYTGANCNLAARRDRKATAECEVLVNATGWWAFTISTALAQAWYDGTANENGVLLTTGANEAWFRSTEYGSNQPFFVFTYTSGAPPEGKPGKNIMSGGIIK